MTPQVNMVIEELTNGNLVLIVDQFGHGKLTSLVDYVTPSQINFMITNGRGMVSVGIEKERASQLDFHLQDTTNTDNNSPAYTISVDVDGTTTGISVYERFDTIKAIIDPNRQSGDFKKPGHIFPVIAHTDGILGKQTHTEAGIALAKLSHSYPAVVMCDVLNDHGEITNYEELQGFAEEFHLEIIFIDDLLQHCLNSQLFVKVEKQTNVKNHIGEFEFITYSNKLDTYSDYIFYNKDLHYTGVTFVFLHKECDLCKLAVCNCHSSLHSALSKVKELGGVCVFIKHREPEKTSLSSSRYTTLLAKQLLESFGINNANIINDATNLELLLTIQKEEVSI
ncbi:3,4-dihydroxy-2-butanone-4-phosphate synthase [Metabacillus litoralis]|uniref:3,4-dihydroxy-2-butanone-4-phosphate synthase n=1 Tax=Metabacillus litoralis TaxID=152268 RepID=UPI00203A491C|nr:3,4-dihydroxy-2-butanone-4-phosphate synthase [Metabacillus litoralis]MCM3653420.1 3,4-dihydroxy-2-butanone-4-phosphate synthase [Metabacillus litoralis]